MSDCEAVDDVDSDDNCNDLTSGSQHTFGSIPAVPLVQHQLYRHLHLRIVPVVPQRHYNDDDGGDNSDNDDDNDDDDDDDCDGYGGGDSPLTWMSDAILIVMKIMVIR